MIQRIQTIWLLLAAACSLATLKLSFYSGNKDNNLFAELNGMSNFALLILAVGIALLALVTIFLYKNRKLQIQLSLFGFLLQVIVLVIYFMQIKKYIQGNFTLTSVLSFIIPVFFILAWLGIRKDEKLIKSMDRLR
jgi:drug/metabolite transporter (DMT)-like permease